VASWLLLAAASIRGVEGSHGSHDGMTNGGDLGAAVTISLAAWTVMVVAMMLPSTMPMLGLFRTTAQGQPHPAGALASFIAGYLVVWTAFGAIALAAGAVLHVARTSSPWLDSHWWLAVAALVAAAGAFQFTGLRERCLHVCRHPFAYLLHRYRPGLLNAVRTGADHGRFCLGCCWALMLLMVAVGLTDLAWMALLTAVMVYEKVGRFGERVARLAGATLLAAALVIGITGAVTIDRSDRPAGVTPHETHDHDHTHDHTH
jgi:predicted metal-binding membrane protein